jgi:hypothetical protein
MTVRTVSAPVVAVFCCIVAASEDLGVSCSIFLSSGEKVLVRDFVRAPCVRQNRIGGEIVEELLKPQISSVQQAHDLSLAASSSTYEVSDRKLKVKIRLP